MKRLDLTDRELNDLIKCVDEYGAQCRRDNYGEGIAVTFLLLDKLMECQGAEVKFKDEEHLIDPFNNHRGTVEERLNRIEDFIGLLIYDMREKMEKEKEEKEKEEKEIKRKKPS